jgi:hypothetical protein
MVRTIYIAWRQKASEPRYIIAKIKRNKSGGILLEYLKDFESAKEKGLDYFFGFRNENLTPLEIENRLSHRIISKERSDRMEYLEFWNAQNTNGIFDVLALTQGKAPTDNFEFLADFYPVKQKKFKIVSDIAGLSNLKLNAGELKEGDILTYQKTPSEFDKDAVTLFKNDKIVGYIKKIHNRIFRDNQKMNIVVKTVHENGIIKQAFITISKQ